MFICPKIPMINFMLKPIISSALLAIGLTANADILMIGDSHTVGPFGKLLHKELARAYQNEMILVYGHSSSAPLHWMNVRPFELSGGISHHVSYNEFYLEKTPDWRIKQPTLNFNKLLDNPVVYKEWENVLPQMPVIDTVIIALGANDRAVISSQYQKRLKILDEMVSEISVRGHKCIWIGPPTSSKVNTTQDDLTHQYLLEGIKGRCAFLNSRKFVAKWCDQVHFSCPEGLPEVKKWATEAAQFIMSQR